MMNWLIGGALVALLLAGCANVSKHDSHWEQPAYESLTLEGPFELRDYAPQTVAEVTTTGSRRRAVSDAFWPLANYIFAKEREGEKIAMTAPVTQTTDAENDAWTVRFVMPAEYSLETLPSPAGAEVRLEELPAMRMAAVKFSGIANDRSIAREEAKLLAWMEGQGLIPAGLPTYAYYNDPFTLPFIRRNEVMVPVMSADMAQR